MIIRCVDVETLGLAAEDGVCELGWCDVVVGENGDVKIYSEVVFQTKYEEIL